MKIFISGGCKNGKSYCAVKLASLLARPARPLYYIATMIPADGEDDERVARHRAERAGLGFTTIEKYRDIDKIPSEYDLSGVFLLDSVTALLANEMFYNGEFFENAHEKTGRELARLIAKASDIVVVSDYIYSDAFIYDPATENYRRGLGFCDKAAAGACDAVIEVAFGGITIHKDTKGFFDIHGKII